MSQNDDILEKLQQLLKHKKSNLYYADRLGVPVEEIEELRKGLKTHGSYYSVVDPDYKVPSFVTTSTSFDTRVNEEKGTRESTIECDYEPKAIEDLAKLHKIDLTRYKISTYWSKLKSNGKFTSSVLASLIKEEEKEKEDFIGRLEEIFSKTTKWSGPRRVNIVSDKALFVYIADDHAGIDFKDSLFGNPYNATIYKERLLKIEEEIRDLKENFDELFIINLGDELDGYNAKTTRYDHPLESLSNKEQFDIYTSARKEFYDKIFERGYFKKVNIININNSNHSGNGYSYIVNKAIEFYITAKYNNVSFINQDKFIASYYWGDHTILLSHGKDEKYMKNPMPFNLDPKTDLWLVDFSKNLTGKWFSTIKGDLHNYSSTMGKSGRYVNVPSICGGSNWIEHNYGSSNSGIIMEIIDKYKKNIVTIPVWF